MFIPPNVVVGGLAVLLILVIAAALCVAWLVGRRQAEAGLGVPDGTTRMRTTGTGDGRSPSMPLPGGDGMWTPDVVTVDRVIRVVALLFIAAVGVVAATSGGVWVGNEIAIFVLLAIGTLFIVFTQDLLPDRLTTRDRYIVEAVGAVTFLTLLVGLTDGLQSPFVVGYFLLVGGAALAAEGMGPIGLAIACALSYAVVGLLVSLDKAGLTSLSLGAFAWLGLNVTALLLLAYAVAMAGRSQRQARDVALRLSRHDTLTGLFNRGAFNAAMEREIKRAERSGRGFCVLMLDMDDLKPVNDTYGHPAGDKLLRAITDVLLHTVRATDLAARYGGDEFVVLLPETDAEGAFVVAEKLRRDISTLAVRVQDRTVRTSVSLGLVAYPEDGRSIDELLSAVDAAMYEAKRRGKNQIVGYTTRTERVATAIGPERPGAGPSRARQVRPDESRAAEIGIMPRRSVREESDEPIEEPPYDRGAGPGRGASWSAGAPAQGGVAPSGGVTAAGAKPAAGTPVGLEGDPLDAAAPAFPISWGTAIGIRPEVEAPWDDGAVSDKAVPATADLALNGTAPAAGGSAVTSPSVTLAPAPARPSIRVPSMPSLPAQSLRMESDAQQAPVPERPSPVAPRDGVSGRAPVPPPDAPWQTHPAPPATGSQTPATPRAPADRQYVVFPIEGDGHPR